MSKFHSVSRYVLSLGLWLAMMSPVWAQSVGIVSISVVLGQADAGGQGGSKYGFSWAIILLFIILGLMITLKSSGRKTEFRKAGQNYDAD